MRLDEDLDRSIASVAGEDLCLIPLKSATRIRRFSKKWLEKLHRKTKQKDKIRKLAAQRSTELVEKG